MQQITPVAWQHPTSPHLCVCVCFFLLLLLDIFSLPIFAPVLKDARKKIDSDVMLLKMIDAQ